MAIVYQHKRRDSGEIFYIGIGVSKNRAYDIHQRSDFWKRVAKERYVVEILFENLTWQEACQVERFLIKLHGRRDLNLGPLVNLTDGGDGGYGVKHSAETIEKRKKSRREAEKRRTPAWGHAISKGKKGKRQSEASILKMKNTLTGRKLDENHIKNIKASLIGKKKSKEHAINIAKGKGKLVNQIHQRNREIIKTWPSISEASRQLKIPVACICCACSGKQRTAGGYLWEYI